jgi:hypothetical protein
VRPPGTFGFGIAAGGETQLTPVPGGRDIVRLNRGQSVGLSPAPQVNDDLGQPVVVHRQERLQIGRPGLPPDVHMAFMEPAQADAHLGDSDVLALGQRLLGRRRHPALQTRSAHGAEGNVYRDRSEAEGRKAGILSTIYST